MAREKRERVPEPEPDAVRYGAAVAEIEQILASIDRDEIDIDELSQKVERAVDLLKICRARLKATELRVTQVLKDVAAGAPDDEDDEDDENDDAHGTGSEAVTDAQTSAEDAGAAGETSRKGRRKAAADPDEELPF